jgi:hypothetical protein
LSSDALSILLQDTQEQYELTTVTTLVRRRKNHRAFPISVFDHTPHCRMNG